MIDGKYRVERMLGRGGMGVVFAATHLDLQQEVALKILLPTLARDEIAVERFLREARAAVQLKSEHVARVLDVGRTADRVPYMVIEYLDGADLGAVLEHRRQLAVSEAADFVLQACEAIAEAHARGIVHRDIKPQNLFVTRSLGGEPLVKVLDFGISKSMRGTLSALTRVDGVVGSPIYMAPEQLRASKDVDARSDIWSLGVVLQELVTGRMPFEADGIAELTLKIACDAPRGAQLDRPDLPVELLAILQRCLQKDPEARFTDVAELEDALRPLGPPPSSISARVSSVLQRATLRTAPTGEIFEASEPPTSAARAMVLAAAPERAPRHLGLRLAIGAAALAALVGSVALMHARTPLPASAPSSRAVTSAEALSPSPVVEPLPSAVEPMPSAEIAPRPAAPSVAAPVAAAKPRRVVPTKSPPKNDEIPSMR